VQTKIDSNAASNLDPDLIIFSLTIAILQGIRRAGGTCDIQNIVK
jgi:hypothetical protein